MRNRPQTPERGLTYIALRMRPMKSAPYVVSMVFTFGMAEDMEERCHRMVDSYLSVYKLETQLANKLWSLSTEMFRWPHGDCLPRSSTTHIRDQ